MGIRKCFSREGKVDILVVHFRLLTIHTNANRRSHNALPLLHHKENDPRYCNSPKNALRWQQCFFSHRIKLVGSNISFHFSHRMVLFTP